MPDTPQDTYVPPTFAEQAITCIFNCSEQNTQVCRKCSRHYCVMHANRFSPNFCKECFSNIALMESKFQRTFEVVDQSNMQAHMRVESCKRWYMDGPDWPFLNLWIDNMSDDELRVLWNFHFFVMKTIEAENETRKIERAKKAREAPKLISTVHKVAGARVTVTKVQDTADDIRKKLRKSGVAEVTIEQMVKAMGL